MLLIDDNIFCIINDVNEAEQRELFYRVAQKKPHTIYSCP